MQAKPPLVSAGRAGAIAADRTDPLAPLREQFVITDPTVVYFDGNSLGRLPKQTINHLQHVILSLIHI